MGDPTNSLSFFRLSRGRAIRPIRLPPWLPLKAASQLNRAGPICLFDFSTNLC
jgi:hypothetical protein